MKRFASILLASLALSNTDLVAQDPLPRPKSGEAVVWYLGHCGYAARTTNHLLIFDYQEKRDGPQPKSPPHDRSLAQGWIDPQEIRGLSVRVFVSHAHADHYDPVILSWKEAISDIEYYFGWKVSEDSSLHCLEGPYGQHAEEKMHVATINSHHSGVPEVAWLVKTDGVVIYHNGDCQPDDPVAAYEVLNTSADRIDIAFVPPTHEERLKYSQQNEELFRRFSPRLVFPMHATAGSAMYEEFRTAWTKKRPELEIAVPMSMGERFVFRAISK